MVLTLATLLLAPLAVLQAALGSGLGDQTGNDF